MKKQKVQTLSEARTVLSGVKFGESPRWHDGRLWFCDWADQQVIAVDNKGNSEVMVRVPFVAFGMSIDWLPDGRLLVVAPTEGRLLQSKPDGSLGSYADLTHLSQKGIPWNEIVVDGRGNAYVNNLGFGFPVAEFAPGTIGLVTRDGSASQVADGIAFPNGMAVTPDNSTLIVAESYGERLTAFDIGADGSLANRRVWAATPGDHPDGICLDAEGAVWYADVGNKHCVRVRQGGEVLQTITIDRACYACMLGGPDRKTLFIVAREFSGPDDMTNGSRTGQVLVAEAPVAGAGRP